MAFCTKCGKPLADDARFCGSCGSEERPVQQPAQQPTHQPQQPVSQPVAAGNVAAAVADTAVKAAKASDKPFAIIAKTVKGKGVSYMENKCEWHGSAPNAEQYEIGMKDLNGVSCVCNK